jgi:hypothetical protein
MVERVHLKGGPRDKTPLVFVCVLMSVCVSVFRDQPSPYVALVQLMTSLRRSHKREDEAVGITSIVANRTTST